jgi:hypothetical protein
MINKVINESNGIQLKKLNGKLYRIFLELKSVLEYTNVKADPEINQSIYKHLGNIQGIIDQIKNNIGE